MIKIDRSLMAATLLSALCAAAPAQGPAAAPTVFPAASVSTASVPLPRGAQDNSPAPAPTAATHVRLSPAAWQPQAQSAENVTPQDAAARSAAAAIDALNRQMLALRDEAAGRTPAVVPRTAGDMLVLRPQPAPTPRPLSDRPAHLSEAVVLTGASSTDKTDAATAPAPSSPDRDVLGNLAPPARSYPAAYAADTVAPATTTAAAPVTATPATAAGSATAGTSNPAAAKPVVAAAPQPSARVMGSTATATVAPKSAATLARPVTGSTATATVLPSIAAKPASATAPRPVSAPASATTAAATTAAAARPAAQPTPSATATHQPVVVNTRVTPPAAPAAAAIVAAANNPALPAIASTPAVASKSTVAPKPTVASTPAVAATKAASSVPPASSPHPQPALAAPVAPAPTALASVTPQTSSPAIVSHRIAGGAAPAAATPATAPASMAAHAAPSAAPAADRPAPPAAPAAAVVRTPLTSASPVLMAHAEGMAGNFVNSEPAEQIMHVGVGRSIFVDTRHRLTRVYVTDPTVLNTYTSNPNQIVVTALKAGNSTVMVWDEAGDTQAYLISSDMNVESLQHAVTEAFPQDSIRVEGNEDRVVLTGYVGTEEDAVNVGKVAGQYSKSVTNSLVVNSSRVKQVRLKVRIVEVDRSKLAQFGFNFFSQGGKNVATTSTNQFASTLTTTPGVNGSSQVTVGNPLNFSIYSSQFNVGATLEDLAAQNVAQILAEPTITSMSGQKASFLSGGEFPFPVVQASGAGSAATVTIQFRPYGVKVEFTPRVNPDGTIDLKVAPEVSALDFSNAVSIAGYTIPALSTRKADTQLVLQSGQSFAISGLLDRRITDVLDHTPGIASVPVLGELFKSKNINHSIGELVVIVTPTLVDPLTENVSQPATPQGPVPFIEPQKFDQNLPKGEKKQQ